MKNKLNFLIKTSLKKKMKTKWFAVANILLAILIVGIINIDTIIKFFGGDFNAKNEILVIDNTNLVYKDLKDSYEDYGSYIEDFNYSSLTDYKKGLDSAKDEVKEKHSKLILIIDKDENNFLKASIISYDGVDAMIYQVLTSSLNNIKKNLALEYFDITPEKLAIIDNPIDIEKERLDEGKNTDEMMELVMGVAFPIMILPFFMLTMYLVQMIGAEINEEKTTKSMEIIISNVSPKTHFFSKLISSNVFVILQGLLLLIYAVIGLGLRLYWGGGNITGESAETINKVIDSLSQTGFIANLGYILPLTLILMLITFVAYSLVAGILASMTTNMEDYQQVQSPIILISVVGYYLSMMAAMFDGSTLIKVLSYVPFLSAMLSPALLVLGQITVIDVIISGVILILFVWLLFKYGLKIYKVGILNYSSLNIWKRMFKAAKEK